MAMFTDADDPAGVEARRGRHRSRRPTGEERG
jgi:hypothetical protein